MIWIFRHLFARVQQSIRLYFRNKKINRSDKPKCTVVAWSLSHNPVGRAFLFADLLKPEYDTKLIGPIFSQYGERLWKPLRGYPLNVESFIAKDFPDFLGQVVEFAENQEAVDLVIICKPRLPSILIGLLIAQKNNAKVILDIDDHELSFFENQNPLSEKELANVPAVDLQSPHSESWTRYCESLISSFPFRAISNKCLQDKFKGTVIPHVRDELFFDPWLYNRERIRKNFGYSKNDKVILFLGTPRSHKGFMLIPEALQKLNNPNYKVCLVGKVRGEKMKNEMDLSPYDFIQVIEDIKFSRLPRILMIADLICLLQDPDSLVSKYQMPAKLSDALMMGVPVLATPVEPLRPLIDEGLIEGLDTDTDLVNKIDQMLSRVVNAQPRKINQLRKSISYKNTIQTIKHISNDSLVRIQSEEILNTIKKYVNV